MTLAKWQATGLTFGARNPTRTMTGERVEEARVQVSIYRTTEVVPPGKKRAVTLSEPVLQGAVMSSEAWAELSTVLAAAGATVKTEPRGH